MSLNRVSTAFAFQASTADFLRAQGKQLQAVQQVGDGKRASDLKGFGRQSELLISAKTVQSRASGFVELHKLLSGKLGAQDQSLVQVADRADAAKQAVLAAVSAGTSENLMASLDTLYGQAVDALNAKHSGRYIFAGSQTDVEPVAIKSLAQLENGATSLAFTNDQTRAVNRLDETAKLTTGFLADEVGTEFFDVLKSIQTYHETVSPLNGKMTPADDAFLKGKIVELGDAYEGLLGRVAQNGSMQERLDESTTTQRRRVGTLTAYIADISEVDQAEAISRLQQAEMAVQASAAALNSLRQSSLLNYLPI